MCQRAGREHQQLLGRRVGGEGNGVLRGVAASGSLRSSKHSYRCPSRGAQRRRRRSPARTRRHGGTGGWRGRGRTSHRSDRRQVGGSVCQGCRQDCPGLCSSPRTLRRAAHRSPGSALWRPACRSGRRVVAGAGAGCSTRRRTVCSRPRPACSRSRRRRRRWGRSDGLRARLWTTMVSPSRCLSGER